MLSAPPVGIPDHALGAYVHPHQADMARIVAQVAVCEALGDEVAWHLIVGEKGALAAYRVVHGNRKTTRRARRR